ncbi:MAG: radical SAM family heme chaperone HemW [Chitinophagales bacterium]|nr:radical SAM family heme chaperone HemW [Chitinophagales bacterium]
MAGIYIHIPFCRQACNYCNFYFSTAPGNKEPFVTALLKEIELSKGYLQGEKIETIYLGGGTPTQLSTEDLKRIATALHHNYDLTNLREFTIEANPDDLDQIRVGELKALETFGLNRFSIGVQSFFDADLKYMNRAHSADEAMAAIKRVQDGGFKNITIDLIYGTPTMNDDNWQKNLETAFALQVPHISSYALTVEAKTTLEKKIKKGESRPVDEEQSARQFTMLMDAMAKNHFEQYEISNFARDKHYAIHNSNYWFGKKYLGLGPSAHSFNGSSRRWNVANNINYINGINQGKILYEEEILTPAQQVNEKIMTALRTQWGLAIAEVGMRNAELIQNSLKQINPAHYTLSDRVLKLTQEGKLFADSIAAALFVEEE